MKIIYNVLLIYYFILSLLFFSQNVNAIDTVIFKNFTIGSPYYKESYRGIITPFSPGALSSYEAGTQAIVFEFLSYSSTLQQNVTVNFYDQDSILLFKVENVVFSYISDSGSDTTGPFPTQDPPTIVVQNDQSKNVVLNSINSLKAAQDNYVMTVIFPVSKLLYPNTNTLPEYLTIGFDLPGYGAGTYNFVDNKIYFKAPAYYGPVNNNWFSLENIQAVDELGNPDYCSFHIVLNAVNISFSYGLYYYQNSYDGSYLPLTSINSNKYYALFKTTRITGMFSQILIIYDALTGQKSNIPLVLNCADYKGIVNTASSDLVSLNSRSFMYVVLTTPYYVKSLSIDSNFLIPTSVVSQKNTFSTFNRITQISTQYEIKIPYEDIAISLTGSGSATTSDGGEVTVVQLSIPNVNIIDKDLKMNYTNSQLRFFVSLSPSQSYYGKVSSIDYSYAGKVFYSDKEIVDNVYKKVIYIPDNIISSSFDELGIYANSDIYSRVLVKTFKFESISSTPSTTTLMPEQEMNLDSSKDKNFINGFNAKNQMGFDSYQIPNIQMSYFTVNKTSSFPQFSEDVKIESNYPFGYTNYFNNLNYQPSVPLMPDTPGSGISCDPSYPYPTTIINDPLTKRDFISPFIFVNFSFSSNLTNSPDSVFITLQDSIVGISSIKPICNVSFGPTTFSLLPENIYSIFEANYTNSVYQFNFKFNRYFCGPSKVKLDCADIRGNKINYNGGSTISNDLISTGLEGCTNINAPLLLALAYSYNSVSNVTINVLFNQFDPSDYSFKVLIYDNIDNIGGPIGSSPLLIEKQYSITQSYTYKAIYSESSNSVNRPTIKRFIAIEVTSLLDSTKSFTLSTKDLEYIDSIYQSVTVTTTVVSSQFIYRNQNYYTTVGAIDFLRYTYDIKLLKDQIIFTSSFLTPIKTITFVVRDKVSPNGLYIYFDSSKSNSYQIRNSTHIIVSLPKVLTLYTEAYIESFCDSYNNCYDLGPYGIKGTIQGPINPPASTLKTTISNPKFSRNYIDVSSGSRTVKVSIDLSVGSSPFVQSISATNPLFYVTEKVSNDQISCPLNQVDGTSTYSCNLQIPYMFGTRGIGHCSIYNIVSQDGYLNGTRFNSCSLFLYSQYLKDGPILTEISTKMYDTTLYFYGINLNLLDSAISDKSIFIQNDKFTFLNSTSGYYTLKEKLVKPMDILVGSRVYSVFIYTCLKDDCSGNGICNMTTLTCSCNQGWGGTDCSIDQTFECKNKCSGNGICSADMTCNCNQGYSGVSCEIKDSNLSMNMNTSVTSPIVILDGFDSHNLNDFTKSSKYSIELVYIQEVDIFGGVVNRFNLNESEWSLSESLNNKSTNIFNTTLLEYSDFRVKIDIIKQDTIMTWANEQISLPANSIKFSVKISNYTFSSNLNRLEMFYQAAPNTELECIIKKQQIAWGAKKSTDMHWVTLPNNQLQLYGRFSNYLIVDDRIVSTSNEGLEFGSTIQVKVNIPFFKDYVELDPDFSVLVDVNMDDTIYDECGNVVGEKSNRKWVIPVAVVVSVVGATVLFVAIFSIAYKKNITLRAKILSLKSRFGRNGGVSMKTFN